MPQHAQRVAGITIVISDEQEVIRDGIRSRIESVSGAVVVGEAGTPAETLKVLHETQPTALFQDIPMGEYTGVEFIVVLRHMFPGLAIIGMGDSTLVPIAMVLDAGANGYIAHDERRTVIADVIRWVADGCEGMWIGPKSAEEYHRWQRTVRQYELTHREIQILRMLEISNREIALTLELAEGTIKNYVSSLLGKLHVRSRHDAIRFGRSMGIISPQS